MLRWEEISPVLDATYQLLNERPNGDVRDSDVEALLPRMTPTHVRRALTLLVDQEYIYGYKAPLGRVDSIMPKERGLQEMMGWPRAGEADPSRTELLLRLLDQRIAAAESEEERTRIQRLRDAAGRTSESVLGEVLGAWLARVSAGG